MPAFAASVQAEENMGETADVATLSEFLKWSFHTTEMLEAFQTDVGVDLLDGLNDFSDMVLPESFLDELRMFLYELIYELGDSNAVILVPCAANYARGVATQYSIQMAYWSHSRNPNRCFESEAIYMFMSHFIDVRQPYWVTGDPNALLRGPEMTRQLLANWITNEDRRVYRNFLSVVGGVDTIKDIADIAGLALSMVGSGRDIYRGHQIFRRAVGDKSFFSIAFPISAAALTGVHIFDGVYLWRDVINQNLNGHFENARNTGHHSLADMHDMFMSNTVLSNMFPIWSERGEVVRGIIGITASLILGWKVGFSGIGLAASAATFFINFYASFFQYAAWRHMHAPINGRVAMRMRYSFGMGSRSNGEVYDKIYNDELMYLIGSLPLDFWDYAEHDYIEQRLFLPSESR